MDINITGNPGTGNSFTEVIVQEGAIYQPNGTTNITNNYYNGKKTDASPCNEEEKQIVRNEVIAYVGKLKSFVKPEWKQKYDSLWVRILSLKEVDAEIYKTGSQKGHTFNRDFVGNIINVICNNVYNTDNRTQMCKALEGKDCNVRKKMSEAPSDIVKKAVMKLLEEM